MHHLSASQRALHSRIGAKPILALIIAAMVLISSPPVTLAAEGMDFNVVVEVDPDGACYVMFAPDGPKGKALHPCRNVGSVIAARTTPKDAGSIAFDAWIDPEEDMERAKSLVEALRSLSEMGFTRVWFVIH